MQTVCSAPALDDEELLGRARYHLRPIRGHPSALHNTLLLVAVRRRLRDSQHPLWLAHHLQLARVLSPVLYCYPDAHLTTTSADKE